MKYKVGNQVRVRPDLKPGVKYGIDTAVDEMCDLCGQVVTISEVCDEGAYYHIEGDEFNFYWTDEMFDMTNGGTIRSMSDKELADWLVKVYENTKTFDEIFEWLKERWCGGE